MARRRRGQFPKPKQENGQWKIRYWTDQAQADGSRCRVRKTKCLGSVDEITATEAKKEASRFLQPINDVEEGIEHSGKTMRDLIARWRVIGPATQAAIDEWLKVAKFTGPDDFMFGILTNTPIDLHNAIARHIKPAARKLGIPEVSWHDLRHTYATWGRRAGIKPETMRDQLGHSSVLMTLDVYSHAQDRAGEAAMIEQYAWPKTRAQGVM